MTKVDGNHLHPLLRPCRTADVECFVRDLGLVVTDIEYVPEAPHFSEEPIYKRQPACYR